MQRDIRVLRRLKILRLELRGTLGPQLRIEHLCELPQRLSDLLQHHSGFVSDLQTCEATSALQLHVHRRLPHLHLLRRHREKLSRLRLELPDMFGDDPD